MKRPAQTAFRPATRLGPQRLGNAALLLGLALLSACAEKPLQLAQPVAALRAELDAARARATLAEAQAAAAAAAASAPASASAAPASAPVEPRFDLVVNGAQARDVYLSLVADTRYSMIVHPAVSGQLSLTLKGVTLREALESLRDVYGYDFRIDGRRVTVYPASMQTRVFSINYLPGQRLGRSELRVSTGAGITGTQNNNGQNSNALGSAPTGTGGSNTGSTAQQPESSRVSTATKADFWAELQDALHGLIGAGEGRSVIASPQASTIAVRAMPEELRAVESFLRATRMAVERQVMLEAKIVEVELREGYQSGVDWSILRSRTMAGQTSVNPAIPGIPGAVINPLVSNSNGLPILSTATQQPAWPDLIPLPSAGGGSFGLALTRGSFQGLISFLESHGDTQILSSPRVATLNNQKAVLKVGSDDYFVTGISSGNANTGNATGTNNGGVVMPTLILTPFFSGIALDVTPQIDDGDTITLHVHPSVTNVTERTKQVDLGAAGNYRLPLASSSVNETDTVVRVPDGAIVAIGGLMQQETNRRGSGLPGADQTPLTATLFGNRANSGRKRELVVLIKSTIIRGAADWEQETARSAQRLEDADAKGRKVIRVGQP